MVCRAQLSNRTLLKHEEVCPPTARNALCNVLLCWRRNDSYLAADLSVAAAAAESRQTITHSGRCAHDNEPTSDNNETHGQVGGRRRRSAKSPSPRY